MELLAIGLVSAGIILLVVGHHKTSEARDFSVRITVLGVYCFVVALMALMVVEHEKNAEKNAKLRDRVAVLEAQLAKPAAGAPATTTESK
ncbi:MAG: hypothetical protein Q7R85_02265 [bacterium]|nr:hypothetical protein [bacterium]